MSKPDRREPKSTKFTREAKPPRVRSGVRAGFAAMDDWETPVV